MTTWQGRLLLHYVDAANVLSECAPKRLIKVMTRIIKPCQHYFDPATIASQVKYVNVFCSSHGPLAFSNLDIIIDHAVMLSNKAMNSKAKRSARHAGVLDLGTTFKHLNCSIRRVPSQITQFEAKARNHTGSTWWKDQVVMFKAWRDVKKCSICIYIYTHNIYTHIII